MTHGPRATANRRRVDPAQWIKQPEARLLAAVLASVAATLAFIQMADEVAEGETGSFDEWVLHAVREHAVRAPDSVVAEIAINLTSLGGYPVLTLLLLSVLGFLLLHRMHWQALYVLAVTTGGALLSHALKGLFARARPALVEPLVHVTSWSFPSGHALVSAVVYLTLGSLLAATVARRRRSKAYLMAMAVALAGIVGTTRVFLGVHYPTDVLAGWLAGLAWSLSCWVVFEALQQRRNRRA